jgi:hypothetical protein
METKPDLKTGKVRKQAQVNRCSLIKMREKKAKLELPLNGKLPDRIL